MSLLNVGSNAESRVAAYVQSLLDLLGDRDPLDVQEKMLEALEQATGGLAPDLLRCPEAPGKWSILQVTHHLADNELVHAYRMRRILTEEEPELEGYDQDRWAEALDYEAGDFRKALERFRALREANLELLRGLDWEQHARVGLHRERGRESIGRIAELIAGHDLLHLNHIERIKRRLGVGRLP